jgi:hypothetical protein
MATVVGVPKEVKEQEGRVWMQPDGVAELGDHMGMTFSSKRRPAKARASKTRDTSHAGRVWSRPPTRSSRLRT